MVSRLKVSGLYQIQIHIGSHIFLDSGNEVLLLGIFKILLFLTVIPLY